MATCKYHNDIFGYTCRFNAEEGKDYCIFHLPINEKTSERFWEHFSNYLIVLMQQGFERNDDIQLFILKNEAWIFKWRNEKLTENYSTFTDKDTEWKFIGFVFPAMDEKFNFNYFPFSPVNFSFAKFCGTASFIGAEFSKYVDFRWVNFWGDTSFLWTKFSGNTSFNHAHFSYDVNFSDAEFIGDLDLSDCRFECFTRFAHSTIEHVVRFNKSTIYNQLLFEGINIRKQGKILLWDINFVHGISKIEMHKEKSEGRIIAPIGEIIFKDIPSGMSRISFLHIEIYGDRPFVKFFNVQWDKDPKKFLFDAQFVFNRIQNWGSFLAVGDAGEIWHIFNPPSGGNELEELVRLDVERISREIRRFYEDFGNYPDAGDYYIAEMEYRRVRTPFKPLKECFYRTALCLYKWVSNYGESPGKALYWLLGIWSISSILYLFTGFSIGNCMVYYLPFFEMSPTIYYLPFFDITEIIKIAGNVLTKAIWFSFINLIPGYFRFANQSGQNTPLATTIISIIEGILGVVVLTLFLLAVRRRFRR